jgi:uncharacterized repeat protein (TIGR01451 family)
MANPKSRCRRRPFVVAAIGGLCLLAGFAVPGSAGAAPDVSNAPLSVTIAAYAGDSVGSTSVGTVDAGSDVTYQVTVSNTWTKRQTNVDLAVNMPTNFVFDNASAPSFGSVTSSGSGTLSWSIAKLPKATSAILDYTVTSDAPDGEMEADGTTVSAASDQSNASNTFSSLEVIPQANVSIGVTDGHQSVSPGQSDTYTITLANAGPSEAPDATVTSSTSGGFVLAFATSSVSGTTFTVLGSGQYQWSSVDLPVGVSATFTLVGQISSTLSAGAAVLNMASVALTPPEIDTGAVSQAVDAEPVIGSGSGSGSGFALSVTAHAGDSPATVPTEEVEAASDLTYQVELANVLPGPQTNVNVPIQLPSNFSLYPASVSANLGSANVTGSVINWTIPTLATGATATLVYSEWSDAPSALEADWTSVGATSDQSTTASSAAAAVDVIPASDISVQVSDADTSISPGGSDVYTITLTNKGPSDAANATLTDTLNGGFPVQSTTSSVGGTPVMRLTPEQIQWTGIYLPAGATATFTISGTLFSTINVGSVLVDVATVTPNPADVDTDASSSAIDWDPVVSS